MNNTVRRYPRSMSEAFPDERACAIERPRRIESSREIGRYILFVLWVLLAVCGGSVAARMWG